MVTPKRRPNYPTEDAQAAKLAGRKVLIAVLEYLENPDGPDLGKDLSSYTERAEAALVELENIDIPVEWNAAVPQDVLDVFARVDGVAEDVMTILHVDDVTGRIHGPLADFRNAVESASAPPPTELDPM